MVAKNKAIIIMLMCIALAGITGYFIFKKNNAVTPPPKLVIDDSHRLKTLKEASKENFSRVSFFHASPLVCSMAIPDYWEGRYRVKEEDGAANFYFINGVPSPVKLFSIVRFTPDGWNDAIKRKSGALLLEIMTLGNTVFAFDRPASDHDVFEDTGEYDDLLNNAESVAGSLKCFPNE